MKQPNNIQLAREAIKASDALRRRKGINITAPVDPVDLAVESGCVVMFNDSASLEGLYSTTPHPTIILGSLRPSGRRAFTCAHELGHHVFKHGTRVDAVSEGYSDISEERLADMFAGYLLMPPPALNFAIRSRKILLDTVTPEHIWALASYFGVGYATVIDHMEYALQTLPRSTANALRQTQPKQFKIRYGCPAENTILFVDEHWSERAITVECGDHLVHCKL